MKILLIKPYVFLHPNENLDVPLGLMSISAYVKKYSPERHEISLLDLRTERNLRRALVSAIRRQKPGVIGLSLTSNERPFLERYLSVIRSEAPGAFIVLGGAYATCDAKEALGSFPELGCVVVGEGEETFLALLRHMVDGTDFRAEPGLGFLDGGRPVVNPARAAIADLDILPVPDYDVIDYERYVVPHTPMNIILAHKRYTMIMTSRACPYHCSFCHNVFGKGFRPRSSEHVLSEISFLHKHYGIREFHIVDDIFNFDRARMHAILNGIISRNLSIKLAFPNGIRGDLLNERDIDLLKQAGAYNITFAIETASKRLQRLIGKNLDVQRTLANIRYAHGLGIITKAFFMVGFPTETRDEIGQTLAMVLDPSLDMMCVFKVAFFPNTELMKFARETYGPDTVSENYNYFTGCSLYEQKTGVPLDRMVRETYLRFYLSPRIIKTCIKLPRKTAFLLRLPRLAMPVLSARYSARH